MEHSSGGHEATPSNGGAGCLQCESTLRTPKPAGFLNVDLEIESGSALGELARELGKSLVVLYCGPYRRSGKKGGALYRCGRANGYRRRVFLN